jgi:hypothetical protein
MGRKGGHRHKSKDALDMAQAHSLFELHCDLIADLGSYETVQRSRSIDAQGLHAMCPLLMDIVVHLCPSAEPKESDLRSAIQRLLMRDPAMNNSGTSNMTWVNSKAEKLSTALNHLRRLKRADALAMGKIMGKLTATAWRGSTPHNNNCTHKQHTHTQFNQPTLYETHPCCSGLQTVLDKITLKIDMDNKSQFTNHSDVHVPTLRSTTSSTSGRSLKRMISDVSVDSHGWPTCLAQLSPEPETHSSPIVADACDVDDGKAKAKPKVQSANVKLDTYGHAKALFEVSQPACNWQKSQARQEAVQLMTEVDVRRRRFEKLRPDLFFMVDGKWKAIDMDKRS